MNSICMCVYVCVCVCYHADSTMSSVCILILMNEIRTRVSKIFNIRVTEHQDNSTSKSTTLYREIYYVSAMVIK